MLFRPSITTNEISLIFYLIKAFVLESSLIERLVTFIQIHLFVILVTTIGSFIGKEILYEVSLLNFRIICYYSILVESTVFLLNLLSILIYLSLLVSKLTKGRLRSLMSVLALF